jgi:hypothetical protein
LDGDQYFDATTYTGTGSSLAITNSGSMQPDFVWLKNRSSATYHWLTNAITGTSKQLTSNATDAESSYTQILTAFNSNGFTVGTDGDVNANGSSYVGWQWRASNSAGVSNTQGTITSTVSANTTAGFSIVTYTGNGSANATVGHGLGVTPAMIIVKSRNRGTYGWNSWHQNLTAGYYISLNTNSPQDNSVSIFPAGGVTSSVWDTGGDSLYNNQSTITYVAYCFAAVSGYSAFGSYGGNGSTDGPFVYTGFRPRYIMIKSYLNGGGGYPWFVYDSVRDTYNQDINPLYPNDSSAESANTVFAIDFLSNGFKLRGANVGINISNGGFIYAAFAENPFKIARGR